MKLQNIHLKELKLLIDEGVMLDFYVRPCSDGFILCVSSASGAKILSSQRSGRRIFKTLDAVFSLLVDLKVDGFGVEFLSGE